MLRSLSVLAALSLAVLPLAAQEPNTNVPTGPDSATFVVTHGSDTVVTERFFRRKLEVDGELDRRAVGRKETYQALLTEEGSVPMVQFAVWLKDDPNTRTPRQRVRIIFRDDSVAVDEVNSAEMYTQVFGSQKGAVPYLNLSFVLLEQATRRLAHTRGDSLAVPFFNLNGGQVAVGTMKRISADSATLQLGTVAFQMRLDSEGRLLGAAIPAQGLKVERVGK